MNRHPLAGWGVALCLAAMGVVHAIPAIVGSLG